MTLSELSKRNHFYVDHSGPCVCIHNDGNLPQELWWLSDYIVSGMGAGVVWMIRK